MKLYVLGFMFSENRAGVALVRKARPYWQRNRWNGIGGEINSGETPREAMVREFLEGTGVSTRGEDWRLIVRYYNTEAYEIMVFCSFSDKIHDIKTMTDEAVLLWNVKFLPANIVFNVRWMIPLCLDLFVRPPIEIEGSIDEKG